MTDDEWAFATLDNRAYRAWCLGRILDEAAGGARRTMVYRMFDAAGTLLYVGRTVQQFCQRTHDHRKKPWWHDVASVTREWHETACGGALAELHAIRSELPLHNIRNHPGPAR